MESVCKKANNVGIHHDGLEVTYSKIFFSANCNLKISCLKLFLINQLCGLPPGKFQIKVGYTKK